MSTHEPRNEEYPDGPGWVTPGYPHLPPPRADLPPLEWHAWPEPPTNPHWVIRETPEPPADPLYVDRRRGLRLAGILIVLVAMLGVAAMVAFRMTGH